MKQEALPVTDLRSLQHLPSVGESGLYHATEPMTAPLICAHCNAVFQNNGWQWMSAPIDSILSRCPACIRVQQKKPAGYLTLLGDFAHDHRNEMLGLIHHIERREKAAYPLKRIMWIEYQEDGVTVTTSDIGLTRDIGNALLRAYKGDLDHHLNEAEEILYVRWFR